VRGTGILTDLVTDIRQAGRALGRGPGFAALAVVVMGLGIGANTAVFSVVNAVLLKPLPYADADRIVALYSDYGLGSLDQVTIADYRDWRQLSTSFDAMATYRFLDVPATPGATAEYARTAIVDVDFFRVFGVEPVIGRGFTRDDIAAGNRVALISYGYWQSRFGGDPAVLTRPVRVNSTDWSIVGVLPAGFGFPAQRDMWLAELTRSTSRTGRNFMAVARLAPTLSLEEARTELKAVAARLEQQYPDSNKGRSVAVFRLQDQLVRDVRLTLYLLWGVAGVVLLIACANTATLLLGKATARTTELALRAALGATRLRIVRQLMAESLLLALAGGAFGMLLAYLGGDALAALAPFDVVRNAGADIDESVLFFTLGVTVVASLVFGIVPALHTSKVEVSEVLKQEGSRAVTAGRAIRTRGALVAVEIGLAVVLLTCAGLLIRTLIALNDVNLGFEPRNVLVMRATGVGSQEETNEFFSEVLSRIAALPGVVAAGATSIPPGDLSYAGSGSYFIDREPEVRDRRKESQSFFTVVAPSTFAALGVPIKIGRDFTDRDTTDAPLVAIVNEELVRRSLPDVNPIGRTIFCNFDRAGAMTIVGVVGDVRQVDPARAPDPECFMPYRQHTYNGRTLHVVIRTMREPTSLVDTVRGVARAASADVPVSFTTMEATVAGRVETPKFRALLFGFVAALAVCLAVIGVYGVMAYSVEHRTEEIGLRMALGATESSVLRLVVGQAFGLAAVGLALGLAGSAAAARLLATVLFEVQPIDLPVYLAVAGLVSVVAATAGYLPARRAASVSPMVALRGERASLLRDVGERLRTAVQDLKHVVSRGSDTELWSATLFTEFAAAARQTDSVTGALRAALTTLCERLGADSAMLLESIGDRHYRSRVAVGALESTQCDVPAEGFLISRLAAFHGPLTFTEEELLTLIEWTAANRPQRVDEVRALATARVRVAVALRTHDDIVGVLLLGPRDADRLRYDASQHRALLTCADQFGLMLENARLTDRVLEQETLRRDLSLAAEVQRRLLPSACPSGGMADFAAVSIPARSIGGDYYDFIHLDGNRIGIALADVSGKGIAAALIMSVVQTSLRMIAADRSVSLSQLAGRMNEFLYGSTPGNRYATFFYAVLDGGRRALHYVNAGHNPPYLIRATRADRVETHEIQELSAGGPVIGLLPEADYHASVVDMCAGDTLLAFTDGVTEAHNPDNEEFGDERLKTLFRETAHLGAEEISMRLTASLTAWIRDAPQYDDLTLVVMKVR
jgi:putative ABC transport system permease protein